MRALVVRCPAWEEAVKKGVMTTESLSGPLCKDPSRHMSVCIATIVDKKGKKDVFVIHGVFYDKLQEVEIEDVMKLEFKPHIHLPTLDYGFCVYSAQEFTHDVINAAKGYLFWPRTQKLYRVPINNQLIIAQAAPK